LRIRIDLGLVLLGVLVFLAGLTLFAMWLILAIISFFLFFIPALQGVFYFDLYVLAASLLLMVAGIVIALSGAKGWWRGGGISESAQT